MLKLKSPVRASELILPLVKGGYSGCRQESRTRIPAARRCDVRKTGQFGTTGRLADGDLYAKAFNMLGKVAEEQGDKARASRNYRKFLDLWKDADPGIPEVED